MRIEQAREILTQEAARLRSGAGGYGGRSPEAHRLAEAIDTIMRGTVVDLGETVSSWRSATSAVQREAEQPARVWTPTEGPCFHCGRFEADHRTDAPRACPSEVKP